MPKHLLDIKKSDATLGDLLERQKSEMSNLFADGCVWDSIITFNEVFPANLSSFWGFEIPLSDTREVDFLLCVHKPEKLQNWIRSLEPSFNENPFFKGLNAFSSNWTRQLKPHISNIWFEYDCDEMVQSNYVPNFFVGPGRGFHPLHMISLVQPLFRQLGGSTSAVTYKCLLNVLGKLPEGSWLSQIGQMLARGDKHLRVFIQDLPKGSIPGLLKSIEYKGKMNTGLLSWLQLASEHCRKVELDLDIAATVGKKIGIELYFDDMESALNFLRILEEKKLCTKEKCDRLYDHLIDLKVDKTALRHRFFSHFKIGFDGEALFKAKAYIGFITKDQMPFAFGTKPIETNLS